MPNLRGLRTENQGVRWDIDFEYQAETGEWKLFQCQVPRDLGDIKADNEVALLELAVAIAAGQGIPEFADD